jgi:succinate-semialdehyde dehydrogenase/glutarate-semialdehyde dehydrogenase
MISYSKMIQHSKLIGGIWRDADSSDRIPNTNPTTIEIIGHVPNCGANETNRAIAAAKAAFATYSRSYLSFRVRLMHDLCDALMGNQEELAQLLTAEQGKPLFESRGEIAIGATNIRWFAEEMRRLRQAVRL